MSGKNQNKGFIFEMAYRIAEHQAIAKKDGKYGYMDFDGEFITPFRYKLAFAFCEDVACVKEDECYAYIDKEGKQIFEWNGYMDSAFSEGLVRVCNKENNGEGFADKTGSIVVECIYDRVRAFSGGLAAVSKNGKWGFIDKAGTLAIDIRFDAANNFPKDGSGPAAVVIGKEKVFIDKTGQIVAKADFHAASEFWEGFAGLEKGGKWAVVDRSGKQVTDFEFDKLFDFHDGLACVAQNDLYGYINTTGKIVVPSIYESAFKRFREGLAAVCKDGLYGFIDTTGKVVIDFQYEDAYNITEGLACVQKNGKYGYIDKAGETVIPFQFEDAGPFNSGIAAVSNGKAWGFLTCEGEMITDYTFMSLDPSQRIIIDDDIYEMFDKYEKATDVPGFIAKLESIPGNGTLSPKAIDSLFIHTNNIIANCHNQNPPIDAFPVLEAFMRLFPEARCTEYREQLSYNAGAFISAIKNHKEYYQLIKKAYMDGPVDEDTASALYHIALRLARMGLTQEALAELHRIEESMDSTPYFSINPDDFPKEIQVEVVKIAKVFEQKKEARIAAYNAAQANETPMEGAPEDWWEHLPQLLEGNSDAFKAHFAPWAVTDECRAILERLAGRFTIATSRNNKLKLSFLDNNDDIIDLVLDPPYQHFSLELNQLPKSYRDVVELHNGVRIAGGPPEYPLIEGFKNNEIVVNIDGVKPDAQRYIPFGEAGQDFWIWDSSKKNAAGEPQMLLLDHGTDVKDAEPIAGQEIVGFGVGGLILRTLSAVIFA